VNAHIGPSFFERKVSRYRQRAKLIGFKGNLLCQHNIACGEIGNGHDTQTSSRVAATVDLVEYSSRHHGESGIAFRCRSR
jgi:hypothetical protein